ncbi:phosphate ABC transporter substrate-binding protein PstS [Sanguibacter antarcticus]|uniref:Phosphate-binding protein n=1 Tax=Sanguibacter antarcticus TaxID=372484 RepID=A0A2A9EAN1_9MICO|nr:phosphate ABC transporter substrate-binding protein PstS [Sanguibacter antarcticus]PFG35270.1 phosphate ABC transporter substrate-binding protein (PhoT family) [Sanguibacter antarcticus]
MGQTVKRVNNRSLTSIALVGAVAVSLAGCGADATSSDSSTSASTEGAELSGNLAGAGASSQEKAMNGWIATYTGVAPDVTVSYESIGSGGGREQFLSGGVQFAGSDAALKDDELESAVERCYGGEAIELPLYISPIAVVYNLPGVDAANLNMSAELIAKIFNGDITMWNDPAIAAENEGVELPDIDIIPVNRSDESGTTENFTEYLSAASNGAWTHEASGDWPISGTQSGAQTSGLIDTVTGAEGAIGYADASRAGDLGTVALKVGDEYVPFSAEAAAKVVDASPRTEDSTDKRLVVELDRTTTESGAYPLVLISYSIACSQYEDEADAANVKAFLSYVASAEGQDVVAAADVAGSAPISDDLRAEAQAAIDSISTVG